MQFIGGTKINGIQEYYEKQRDMHKNLHWINETKNEKVWTILK